MPQQIGRMKELHPGFSRTKWRLDLVRWEGDLQPSDASARYKLAVEYRFRRFPVVSVLSPALQPHENGSPIPHRFADGTLCLYLTNSGEWTPAMYIADTTIPWAAHWLLHYEVWHATGEWLGGGEHPRIKKSRTK
jgi:hypothetical protein